MKSFRRVTDLRPKDTPEDPYFYTFRVQCTSCREAHPNWVNVSRFVSICSRKKINLANVDEGIE